MDAFLAFWSLRCAQRTDSVCVSAHILPHLIIEAWCKSCEGVEDNGSAWKALAEQASRKLPLPTLSFPSVARCRLKKKGMNATLTVALCPAFVA
eukprot:1153420-Pelagomonas_calceolata.AAC.2